MCVLCQKATYAPQQSRRYSITSSAVASTPGEMVRPRGSFREHPARTDRTAFALGNISARESLQQHANRQRLAIRRLELKDVSVVRLRSVDHDPVSAAFGRCYAHHQNSHGELAILRYSALR